MLKIKIKAKRSEAFYFTKDRIVIHAGYRIENKALFMYVGPYGSAEFLKVAREHIAPKFPVNDSYKCRIGEPCAIWEDKDGYMTWDFLNYIDTSKF